MSLSEYAQEVWETQLGSKIVDTIDELDYSEAYEVDAAWLLKLENGKYAVVVERGCSCYDYSDAKIKVHDNLSDAHKDFKSNRR